MGSAYGAERGVLTPGVFDSNARDRGAVRALAPTPTKNNVGKVPKCNHRDGPPHNRTSSSGEQRGTTVKAAGPDEAVSWPLHQVSSRTDRK